MAEPFIAEIRMMPYSYVPEGWAACNGDLLEISEHSALFALLGTTYGGNGRTNFAVPNLNFGGMPRAAMHPGRGPGLTPREPGEMTGMMNCTLHETQMPTHDHTLQVTKKTLPESDTPSDAVLPHLLEVGGKGKASYKGVPDPSQNVSMSDIAMTNNGGGKAHSNMQPYLGINYCIALTGIFPPRS